LFVETLSAEYYWAIKDLDKANEIWDKVMKSDSKADKVPTLINEVAKRRAFILKKYSEELF